MLSNQRIRKTKYDVWGCFHLTSLLIELKPYLCIHMMGPFLGSLCSLCENCWGRMSGRQAVSKGGSCTNVVSFYTAKRIIALKISNFLFLLFFSIEDHWGCILSSLFEFVILCSVAFDRGNCDCLFVVFVSVIFITFVKSLLFSRYHASQLM